jgi:hypothetical protein
VDKQALRSELREDILRQVVYVWNGSMGIFRKVRGGS